jgi:hypothetical protein
MLVVSPPSRSVVHHAATPRGLATLLAAALLLPPGASISAGASEPTAALPAEQLEIDTDALDRDARTPVQRRIREGVAQAIRLFQEYADKDLDPGAKIRVRVVPLSGKEVGYSITLEGLLDGRLVDGSPPPLTCSACTETEMVDKVVEQVGLLLPKLQPEEEPETEGEGTSAGDEPRETDLVEPTFDGAAEPGAEPRPKLGALGKAGIAVLAVGAVGVGVGLGLGLREDTWDADSGYAGNAGSVGYISTKTPGWAVLGVGGALLVTGTVLLVYDVRRAKKSRRTAIAPYLDQDGAGLTLLRRF